ncbi:MAG: L,D-transpeptidase family protein [Marinifilaceae bacterium]|jgi:murein L,D-transpeptidase YafK|nr:L,D-transpeptidase family protein [Marinifilaceae bacterium]
MKTKGIIKLFFSLFIILSTIFYLKPNDKINQNIKIDKIIVNKSEREMILLSKSDTIATYPISLGREPRHHKQFEGDMRTPEGIYYINDKNPNSNYYKNLGISYPNNKDIENAKKLGKDPGGMIKIHGMRNGFGFIGRFHLFVDWTQGCIALTDDEMEELYQNISVGTIIEIRK